MGRAADARIVVADRLLAFPLEAIVGQIDPWLHELEQVLLDPGLVLEVGGTIRASAIEPSASRR